MSHIQIALALACSFIASGLSLLAVAVYMHRVVVPELRWSRLAGKSTCHDAADLLRRINELTGQTDQRLAKRMQELERLVERADGIIAEHDSRGGDDHPDQPHDVRARRGEVLRLCEEGLSTVEIARRTNVDVGEVELLANLHRTGKA